LIFTIASCADTRIAFDGTFPGIDLPISEMNTRIRLTAPEYVNSFTIGDTIAIEVDNLSDTPVEIVLDKDIKVFTKQGNGWTEIENYYFYSGTISQVPVKSPETPVGIGFPIKPAIGGDEPVVIRVIVIGTVYKNGKPTSIRTGAYLDLTLYP
jgi:hypothetical protein